MKQTLEERLDEVLAENNQTEHDPVNHPSHYTDGGIETLDFIVAKKLDFFLGQVCKYISRAGKKDPDKELEDLKKARFYLDRKISLLEKEGVPTHLVEEISDRETIVKKVSIVPLEVIIRNVAAGSFSKRMGVEEGKALLTPILEFSYKNDDLGDPFINDYYALALGLATREELDTIAKYAFKVNEFMIGFFKKLKIDLIDFKIEFGKTADGQIILADEISPDTCRFWDSTTHEKLDKDRFRRDLGGVEEAYQEISHRLFG